MEKITKKTEVIIGICIIVFTIIFNVLVKIYNINYVDNSVLFNHVFDTYGIIILLTLCITGHIARKREVQAWIQL